MYNETLTNFRVTFCFSGQTISITYSEYVFVSLVIKHSKSMRCVILPSVASLALPYFSTLSHKKHEFLGEKNIERNMFVLNFSIALV